MAMVEAILKPDSPYRRHGFATRWSATQELAWMDNGGGDEAVWPGVLDAVLDVYELRPLTPEIVTALNPGVTLCQLQETISAIGYPTKDAGRVA